MNGKPIGIIESNYEWASKYWSSRCREGRKFTLIEITKNDLT